MALTLESDKWDTISTPRPFPMPNDGAALTFEFPAEGAGSMHYMHAPSPLLTLRGTLIVSLQITTTGPVLFQPVDLSDCQLPPSVRPLIWANNNGEGAFDRWWSNPQSIRLAAGAQTLEVALIPANWSSVLGVQANKDVPTTYLFEKALLNVSRLGLTFGGGCSFGHGISVRGGSARFALTSYTVR